MIVGAGEDLGSLDFVRTVWVWDAATGQELGQIATGITKVTAVAVGGANGHEVIVFGTDDGEVRLWRDPMGKFSYVSNSRIEDTDMTGSVTAIAVAAAGSREVIATGGRYGRVRLWREPRPGLLRSGELLISRSLVGHTRHMVTAVAMGTIGGRRVIISGGDDRIVRVWHTATGKLLAQQHFLSSGWAATLWSCR